MRPHTSMRAFSIHVLLETGLPDDGSEQGPRSQVEARVKAQVRDAATATLRAEGAPDGASLSILLTGDDHVRRLNRDFRQIDKATDVLSFPTERDTPQMEHYLGDVIIAVPVAARQADAAGHSFVAELSLLVVHGVLHLLGHDHLDPGEKERMWAAQDGVLADLGVDVRSPVVEDRA